MSGAAGDAMVARLAMRERWRDAYLARRDPIAGERMLWRAQTFRHMVHLLPGQSILELGCGEMRFTRALAEVSRGECPITAVTFASGAGPPGESPDGVERLVAASLPGALAGRRFDFVVAIDILDRPSAARLLEIAHDLLVPGGQVLFAESNPWNPVLRCKAFLARLLRHPDPRSLHSRRQLYELSSEVGFIRVFSVYTDFVYPPLSARLIRLLRGLSIVLENTPGIQALAGAILLHAQRPPRSSERRLVPLTEHAALNGAVSVVVPCHNEAMNVAPLIRDLLALYGDYVREIVAVDDDSRDGTGDVLRRLAAAEPRVRPVFRSPPNGVGRAIGDGLRAARGPWILSMDCDFRHLLPELRDLFDAAAAGADVVIGSRFSRHSILLNYPLPKIVANRLFHLLAWLLLRLRCRDVTNNLKLMRREVIRQLELREPHFAVNAELGLQPFLLDCRIAEVPISWVDRSFDMGASSFRLLRVGGGYRRVLVGLWLRRAFGRGRYAALGRHAGAVRQPAEPSLP
jgi:dolichol-phosphate mannosyltransferase